MKLLLLPLLLVGAGAGWFGLRPSADEIPAECAAAECRVTVERTGPDTCRVTCYEADGSIRCQQEITCDEACDKPCDKPCAAPGTCPK